LNIFSSVLSTNDIHMMAFLHPRMQQKRKLTKNDNFKRIFHHTGIYEC
jgi:hypothetical protein